MISIIILVRTFFVFYYVWNGLLRVLRKLTETTTWFPCLHFEQIIILHFPSFLLEVAQLSFAIL